MLVLVKDFENVTLSTTIVSMLCYAFDLTFPFWNSYRNNEQRLRKILTSLQYAFSSIAVTQKIVSIIKLKNSGRYLVGEQLDF